MAAPPAFSIELCSIKPIAYIRANHLELIAVINITWGIIKRIIKLMTKLVKNQLHSEQGDDLVGCDIPPERIW